MAIFGLRGNKLAGGAASADASHGLPCFAALEPVICIRQDHPNRRSAFRAQGPLTPGRSASAVGAMNAQVKPDLTDMAARYGVGTTLLEWREGFVGYQLRGFAETAAACSALPAQSPRICRGALMPWSDRRFLPAPGHHSDCRCCSAAAFSSIIH